MECDEDLKAMYVLEDALRTYKDLCLTLYKSKCIDSSKSLFTLKDKDRISLITSSIPDEVSKFIQQLHKQRKILKLLEDSRSPTKND